MDTAGSKDTEVDIKAVSKQISEDIKSISEIIKQKTVKVKAEEAEIIDDKSFQINFKTLVKIGLTSRFFQTLGFIFGSLAVLVQFLADFEFTHTNSTTISIIITGRNNHHGARANGNYVTVEDRQGNLLAPQLEVAPGSLRDGKIVRFDFVYTT